MGVIEDAIARARAQDEMRRKRKEIFDRAVAEDTDRILSLDETEYPTRGQLATFNDHERL